ncbi:MAG: putative glycoside hydrolase [Actinobacteria bacterium]|nr:putative glycoside hydrolase [Actinomycetota bacterium]
MIFKKAAKFLLILIIFIFIFNLKTDSSYAFNTTHMAKVYINLNRPSYLINQALYNREIKKQDDIRKEKIVPGTQKGIYLTGYSMGIKDKRNEIYKLIEETELNCIVFNAKDDAGYINYDTSVKLAQDSNAKVVLYDIDKLLNEMKEHNIYSIARIVVFKDAIVPKIHPEYAIKDSRNGKPLYSEGSYWPDIYCKDYWNYIIEIVKELAQKGVDEIQFDYIRGPAKGNIAYADYKYNTGNNSKSWALQNFLTNVRNAVKNYSVKISADVFGFVLIENNDQGIGQLIEDIAPYLDYMYPMTYPSHYSRGFLGYQLPEAHPYEVVKYTLEKGLSRITQSDCLMVPWIQAFGLKMNYTKDDILAQINASEDLGIKGFLFWNASNKYGIVEQALIERYQQNERSE